MALFFNNRRDMGNIAMGGGMYPGDLVQDERFGVDPATQGAVDRYASLPAPVMEGRKGGGFGDVLRALAGGVLDGVATHYGSQPGYSGARAAREAAIQAAQERQNALQDYEAKRQIDQRYEGPPEPPAMVRNTEAYAAMSPEKREIMRQAYAAMQPAQQDRIVINDGMLTTVPGTMPQAGGMDGTKTVGGKTYQQINGEWFETGGGTGNGVGGF